MTAYKPATTLQAKRLRSRSNMAAAQTASSGSLKGYRDTYFAPRRFLDWYFKALATDPLAGLTWYASHLIRILRGPKRMPR